MEQEAVGRAVWESFETSLKLWEEEEAAELKELAKELEREGKGKKKDGLSQAEEVYGPAATKLD